jgi:voltage-gated potassium channel
MKLKQVIEESDTRAGRAFDLFIQFLIVVSLISFSIETLPGLSETTTRLLRLIEVVTVLLFTLEYLLRVTVADKKAHYILSFYGLVDLLAILPFYIASGIDLRSIRILRLLRMFRILKLMRFTKAIERFRLAFVSIREEIILFMITTSFLIYVSSIGIYYCEQSAQPEHFKSIFHSFWWSVVTLTTVGYGDVYPVTAWGKVFASIVMIIGIGVVAVPSGLIASALTKVIRDEGNTG